MMLPEALEELPRLICSSIIVLLSVCKLFYVVVSHFQARCRRQIRNFTHVELPLHDVGAAADKVEGVLLPDLRAPNGAEPSDEGVLGIAWEGDARKLAENDLGVLAQTTGGLDAEGGVQSETI